MNTTQRQMIRRAKRLYHSIRPCGRQSDFTGCFTVQGDTLMFWFNTEDDSTHMLTCCTDESSSSAPASRR